MQLRHDIGRLGHRRDDVVGEVARMRTREAHALEALDVPAGAQEVGEGTTITELHAVGVDVLSQEGHLDHTFGDEGFDLGEDVTGATVLLLATQRGHDAEGAGVVAADTDRHPRGVRRLAARGQRGREDLETLQDLDLGLLRDTRPLEQGGQRTEVVRAEDDIDPGGTPHDLATVLLSQTAADGDLHPGPAGLDRGEVAKVAVEPVVGVLPHGAGVEDHEIGLLAVSDGRIARCVQDPGDAFGVVGVHLAPVGAHLIGALPGNAAGDPIHGSPAYACGLN